MDQIAILADDFTSVTDCTIPFAGRGLSTAALLEVPQGAFPPVQVLGLNTDSRALLPQDAYRRNLQAAQRLREGGYQRVYKSVDSTLRGNLGAELDGVLDGLGKAVALIAPAFPHYGRTTIGGVHYLNGARLEDSPIARDPACPAKESEIIKILGRQSRRKAARLGLESIRAPHAQFAEAVGALHAQGVGLIVLDAETEGDLEQIARHAALMEPCLVVGSTGLSRHLPEQWCLKKQAENTSHPTTQKPIIVAAASVSPITSGQVAALVEEGGAERCLVSPDEAALGNLASLLTRGEAVLHRGVDLVLQVDASPQARERSQRAAREAGLSSNQMGERIVAALSALVEKWISQGLTEGVVLTGGDMAQALLQRCNSPGISLYGEVEPGIPAGWLMGRYRCLAVTKAGAFGTPRALCAARRFLKAGSQVPLENHR